MKFRLFIARGHSITDCTHVDHNLWDDPLPFTDCTHVDHSLWGDPLPFKIMYTIIQSLKAVYYWTLHIAAHAKSCCYC